MKNIKIKIILSAVVFLSAVGFVSTVSAEGASLYISPAIFTETVGKPFNVHVGFNTPGIKVCTVEGTLVFKDLSCQSITVVDDVIAQSSPTCSNPHFLISIPNCTTSVKILLTVSVQAGSVGTASIIPTGVDIRGEDASVGTASRNGNYTIDAVSKTILDENLPANIAAISLATIDLKFADYLWIASIILISIGYIVYYFIKRKKK